MKSAQKAKKPALACENGRFFVQNDEKTHRFGGFFSLFRLSFLHESEFVGVFTDFERNLSFFIGNFNINTRIFTIILQEFRKVRYDT
jgi:hypothetical protein